MYFYQKIASYYLCGYTHVRDLGGGGGFWSQFWTGLLPPPAWSGASDILERLEWIEIEIGKRKNMNRNTSSYRYGKSSERYKLH